MNARGFLTDRLSHLRVRHLELLVALADGMTVSAAASRLAVTAPAASMMLREIESLLGVRLYERERRGAVPTRAGAVVGDRCRVLCGEIAALRRDLDAARQGERPVLRVGAIPQAMIGVVPKALSPVRQWPQGATLRLVEGSSPLLVQQVRDGALDCAIARLLPELPARDTQRSLRHDPLYRDQIVMVVGTNHPFARRARTSLAQIAEAPWALPVEGSYIRAAVIEGFRRAGLAPPRIRVELTSAIYGLLSATQAGYVTAGPVSVVRSHRRTFGLHPLPHRIEAAPSDVVFLFREESLALPACTALRERVLEVCGVAPQQMSA